MYKRHQEKYMHSKFAWKELPEVGVSNGLGCIDIGVDLGIGIDIVLGVDFSIGFGISLGILGMGSFMSTTTASDVRKVLATDAACSKQHLTTCTILHLIHIRKLKSLVFLLEDNLKSSFNIIC